MENCYGIEVDPELTWDENGQVDDEVDSGLDLLKRIKKVNKPTKDLNQGLKFKENISKEFNTLTLTNEA